jgi:hypothetical protein
MTYQNFPNAGMAQAAKISTIASLAELNGYERQAKARGITVDEIKAIFNMRKRLTQKRKRK